MDEELIEPQADKPKPSVIVASIVWIKQQYPKILTVGSLLIALIFWFTKDKEPELITNAKATATELRNCLHDDIITGTVLWKTVKS